MTEGLVRTSTAPCLSCAAGGLRKKDKETMRRTAAYNRTQVVMESTVAKHPVLERHGGGGSLCGDYDVLNVSVSVCVCTRVGVSVAGPIQHHKCMHLCTGFKG